ncbi:ACT domain-containing protein, partial [Staphylococcus sp. SIMBA_130]
MNSYSEGKIQAFQKQNDNRARFLIKCPDQPGIVAAVSKFLYEHNANIVASDQFTMNPEGGEFFIRIEFECPDLKGQVDKLETTFLP